MKVAGKVARGSVPVVWAVVLLIGCSEPLERSHVRVEIDADDAVRAASVEVNVRVEKAEDPAAGWYTVAERRFTPTEAKGWPIRFQLPSDEQPGSYQLTATAHDGREAVLGLVRVIRDFRDRSRGSILRAFFEVECLRLTALCQQGLTCHDGECVSSESTDEQLGTTVNAQRRAPAPAASSGTQDAGATALGRADDACTNEGETACAQGERQMPLTCHDGRWRAELPCQQNERCVASQGSCRAIARECVGRGDDDVFCDGATMRDCSDPVAPPVRPCGEHATCAVRDGNVGCACSLGFVKDVVDCRPATACETDHGGCDGLASCSVVGSAVQCGACPSGYAGDGRTGCLPLLAALEVSGAMLSPALLASDARDYRARVPLLTTRAQLTASGPPDTTLEIDTHPIAPGMPWISPILDYGDNAFELAVVSRTGVRNVYHLIIQRDGEQRAYVKAGAPSASDWLGLAWMSATQDTLVVGAPWEDGGSTKINGDETSNGAVDSGAAYVFVRDGQAWTKQAYLKASDAAASDFFAASTAVSGDTIAIGARRTDFVGLVRRPGAVYVFDRKKGAWSQTVRITPQESAAGDLFGNAVSIEADTLVVGAPRAGGASDSEGAAYVYTRTGGAWTLEQTLRASKPVPRSNFGTLVTLRDGVLVVSATEEDEGAGAAYVFTRGPEGWLERQRLAPDSLRNNQRFGWTVDTLGDMLVIGAPFASDLVGSATLPAGETYVFQRTGDTWQQVGVLSAVVPRSNDYFGASVALTSQAIVIGASGDDSDGRGVRADPRRTGANQSGAAYVFSRDPAGWRSPTFIKASNTETDDSFGWTVAATETDFFISAPWESSDGDQADNSVTNSGALYVFR